MKYSFLVLAFIACLITAYPTYATNKEELIQRIVSQTGINQEDVEDSVESLLLIITQDLEEGGSVTITGFGTFSTRSRPPRIGRNPQTGETINLPGRILPVFKPGKKLMEAVSRGNP